MPPVQVYRDRKQENLIASSYYFRRFTQDHWPRLQCNPPSRISIERSSSGVPTGLNLWSDQQTIPAQCTHFLPRTRLPNHIVTKASTCSSYVWGIGKFCGRRHARRDPWSPVQINPRISSSNGVDRFSEEDRTKQSRGSHPKFLANLEVQAVGKEGHWHCDYEPSTNCIALSSTGFA